MIFLRLTVAVAVVVGLLLLTARLTRRVSSKGQGGSRSVVRVVARQPLSRYASVAVVQHGSRTFVLGVTDHSVSLIAEQTDLTDNAGPTGPTGRDSRSLIADGLAISENPSGPDSRRGGASPTGEPATPLANLVESMRERTIRRRR